MSRTTLSSIPEDEALAESIQQTPEKAPPPLQRQQASRDFSALLANSLLKPPTNIPTDQGIGTSPPSSLNLNK